MHRYIVHNRKEVFSQRYGLAILHCQKQAKWTIVSHGSI